MRFTLDQDSQHCVKIPSAFRIISIPKDFAVIAQNHGHHILFPPLYSPDLNPLT